MNKWVKAVPKSTLYIEFVKALNGILNLSDRQMELLAYLIHIDVTTPKSTMKSKNVISAENRKRIHKDLKMGFDNLSKHIKKFKQMGILVKGRVEDEVAVNPSLIPDVIGDRVQLTIILKLKDERKNLF